MSDVLYVHTFESPWGNICTASLSQGLAIVTLPGQPRRVFEKLIERHYPAHRVEKGGRVNSDAEAQITEYLSGERKRFSLELSRTGTPFQRRVLDVVSTIPYGHTVTYGSIAQKIGNPGSSRAVGTANGSNCLPIIIPCHRVVASNGLGGYGGGHELKYRLLQLEGAVL